MVKVGLTGGMGSGKTTALGFFKKAGAVVASSDEWVHEELSGNAGLRDKIVGIFGPEVLKRGQLDRRALAGIVFKEARLIQRLNGLLHPAVARRLSEFIKERKRAKIVVVEVPLLFEAHFDKFFDWTIGVATDPRRLRARLKRRGPGYVREFERRMRWQLPAEEKISRCDFVIDNSGSLRSTSLQINKLMEAQLWKS
jgi:dephospho-CoA kinase